jgi:hypothetical protein
MVLGTQPAGFQKALTNNSASQWAAHCGLDTFLVLTDPKATVLMCGVCYFRKAPPQGHQGSQ